MITNVAEGDIVAFQLEGMSAPRVGVVERAGNIMIHVRDKHDSVMVNILQHWVKKWDGVQYVEIEHKEQETKYDPEFDRHLEWFEE